MPFTLGVPRETTAGERRVALIPDIVARLTKKGIQVLVESGAGNTSFISDTVYAEAGAVLVSREAAFEADVVVKVQPPTDEEVALFKAGSAYIGFLSPLDDPSRAQQMAAKGLTALSMELVPRISRAQKMDALSAMSAIGGYKAVLMAADRLPKFFPLLTTAAGTVRPANVLVLGAGVAGLQAIATARRLGARVSAYDIREAAREEVQSLGASFVELPLEIANMQDAGGYAKALAEEKQKRQTELLVPFIGKADVVVTTALIPGRRAPLLITEEAVAAMQPGSVIVDMAAANGGNCAFTEPGKTIVQHDVTIIGHTNLPAEMPVHASQMYARTLFAMIEAFTSEQGFAADMEDDVFKGACVVLNGEVVHERVKKLVVA